MEREAESGLPEESRAVGFEHMIGGAAPCFRHCCPQGLLWEGRRMDESGVGEREDKGEWCILWGHHEQERRKSLQPTSSAIMDAGNSNPPAADLKTSRPSTELPEAPQTWS